MSFKGKVILITGAASGIGAETAKQFAQLNATLVAVDINSVDFGPGHLSMSADLTNDHDVRNVVQRAIDRFGRIDILANVAGIAEPGGIQRSTMDQFDRVTSVNIRAVYHLTLLCVPHLIESKGCIVNVSSYSSKKVTTDWLVYSLTKVATDHLTKSLAVELASKGVRVNAVNPGPVETPMLTNAVDVGACARSIPLGRIGSTNDIARAILFLASDSAGYITGETLSVDGAIHLT